LPFQEKLVRKEQEKSVFRLFPVASPGGVLFYNASAIAPLRLASDVLLMFRREFPNFLISLIGCELERRGEELT
jgi:hypothetical protein